MDCGGLAAQQQQQQQQQNQQQQLSIQQQLQQQKALSCLEEAATITNVSISSYISKIYACVCE